MSGTRAVTQTHLRRFERTARKVLLRRGYAEDQIEAKIIELKRLDQTTTKPTNRSVITKHVPSITGALVGLIAMAAVLIGRFLQGI